MTPLATERAAAATANVARHLERSAREHPDALGVLAPAGGSRARGRGGRGWRRTSFAELDQRARAIAAGLEALGLDRGDRVSVFLRPGPELVATTYALFRLGAVPVLIDPGMGRAALADCVRRAAPRALIAVPAAHVFRALHPASFRSVEIAVADAPRWPFGAPTLASVERFAGPSPTFASSSTSPLATSPTSTLAHALAPTTADDPAAVLFTSGSTGPPKGVIYTHGMFDAQVRVLRTLYGFEPGEVDLACFPLFALFDAALGMTSVFPRLDPSHPARCDPELVLAAAREHAATTTFGSPAIWRRVAPWCQARGERLASLRRILIAGAPVPPALVEACHALAPAGEVHTPYGATEALPVTSIDGREILALRERVESGSGTCVGRPAPEIELRLVHITDEPIETWSDALEVPPGEPGEVCVRGPVVTREYLAEPTATAAAKITDARPASPSSRPSTAIPLRAHATGFWHRMGDIARLDADGRLWFLGRKSHRIETAQGLVMPVPAENVCDLHPAVRRTALVGVGPRGAERPTLVVEPEQGNARTSGDRKRLSSELCGLLRTRWRAGSPPELARVLFHPALPVDVRHNAKIRRETLKRWAESR